MTAARQIETRVNSIAIDKVFSIADLGFPSDWWENIRVKLSRMAAKGTIKKLRKGRYYRPRKSVFGIVPPPPDAYIKDLLVNNSGKTTGYLTGYAVWNKMGLTTQISNIIEIATNKRRNPMKRGEHTIRFTVQPNRITKTNIPLLQILDAIKSIKNIPDSNTGDSVARIKSLISNIDTFKYRNLVSLAAAYPPRVSALVGAILDEFGHNESAAQARMRLNPSTIYNYGNISEELLPNKSKWNIK